MRIAQVCHRYYPDIGGVETHVREISEKLAKQGYEVEVVCTDPTGRLPKQETIDEVKVTRFKSFSPQGAIHFAPQLYFYLKKEKYDLVHAHNYHALPALFAAMACKRIIFTPHYHGGGQSEIGNLFFRPYQIIGSYIFKKAEKIICVSKYEMKRIKKDFQVPSKKLIHIPNGLNLDEFKDIRPLERSHKTILYVGRLEKYKGIQHIINALPRLQEYKLEIVGTGPYKKQLQEQARKLGVKDRISWLKNIERKELLARYKSADVFVNLSIFEAYGITVAEALASGTPCVVARGGALEEFIDGNGCMGLNHPISPEALIHAIESRKRIPCRRMLDWEDVVSDLIEIYQI